MAVVGSRSATTYGADVAADIAATLVRESWTVVSGAAFGIDQAAHRGALANRAAPSPCSPAGWTAPTRPRTAT